MVQLENYNSHCIRKSVSHFDGSTWYDNPAKSFNPMGYLYLSLYVTMNFFLSSETSVANKRRKLCCITGISLYIVRLYGPCNVLCARKDKGFEFK